MQDSLQIYKTIPYGLYCKSMANFYKWAQAFKDGHRSITDESRSERHVDVLNPKSSTRI